jgi:hypothetical protein
MPYHFKLYGPIAANRTDQQGSVFKVSYSSSGIEEAESADNQRKKQGKRQRTSDKAETGT